MDTIRPPPPTAVPPKPKPKLKKTNTQKKTKNVPSPTKVLSPIPKTDKSDNPKQKLYDLYENYQTYDHKRADAEIRVAEQKQIEVLRDMLVKGFAVKNLQSLHNNLVESSEKKKKNVGGKINDRGDGFKLGASDKNLTVSKTKGLVKTGNTVVKKAKPLKKPPVKKK